MRFFLDSASSEEARRIKDLGLLDGIWTSPALAREAGIDYRKAIRELSGITDGPVLAELEAEDTKGMYKESRELAKLGKDVVIRLPLRPEGMRVARLLAQDQVAVCASDCFSAAQALIAAKANVSYVAPAGASRDLAIGGRTVTLLVTASGTFVNFSPAASHSKVCFGNREATPPSSTASVSGPE